MPTDDETVDEQVNRAALQELRTFGGDIGSAFAQCGITFPVHVSRALFDVADVLLRKGYVKPGTVDTPAALRFAYEERGSEIENLKRQLARAEEKIADAQAALR